MTESGNLTKEEILSIDLLERKDTTHTYVEAIATIDGETVTVEVTRVKNRVRGDSDKADLSNIVEEVATAVQKKKDEPDEEEEPSAL